MITRDAGTVIRKELMPEQVIDLALTMIRWYGSLYEHKVATDEEVATDITTTTTPKE